MLFLFSNMAVAAKMDTIATILVKSLMQVSLKLNKIYIKRDNVQIKTKKGLKNEAASSSVSVQL